MKMLAPLILGLSWASVASTQYLSTERAVQDEGAEARPPEGGQCTPDPCYALCDAVAPCNSFAHSPTDCTCWFKDKCITGQEPIVPPDAVNNHYKTYYKPCGGDGGFDVIVVGAGLVGSAVAGKLSETLPQDRKVLVLEAGPASHASLGGTEPPASWNHDTNQWDEFSGGLGSGVTRFDVPGNYPSINCWDWECDTGGFANIPGYACKILGGCSVMNGALSQRPVPEMFSTWPAGWQSADMQPYFDAIDDDFTLDQTPSADNMAYLEGAGASLVRSALQAEGYVEDNTFQPSHSTMARPFVTASGGLRQSTASVFLPGAQSRSNFELRVNAHVTAIAHDGNGQAMGVTYEDINGASVTVTLKPQGLLVLAAGAFNTPKLLFQSNVVPTNTWLGKGLSEHSLMSVKYAVTQGITETFDAHSPSQAAKDQYTASKSGPLAQFGPILTAFYRDPNTATGGPDAFDVEMFVSPTNDASTLEVWFALMRPACSAADLVLSGNTLQFANNQLKLACAADRNKMQNAMDFMKDTLAAVGATETTRQSLDAPHDMNHWGGSCKLVLCVDSGTLLVHGSSNVAVADASLLPGQVWGHPVHTLRAMALKIADSLDALLRSRWGGFAATTTTTTTTTTVGSYQSTVRVVQDEGGQAREPHYVCAPDPCYSLCDASPTCKSFSHSAQDCACWFKDKCIEGNEPIVAPSVPNNHYKTYFKPCTPVQTWIVTERVVQDEGEAAEGDALTGVSDSQVCRDECDARETCNSFAYGFGQCWFKRKCVTASDPIVGPTAGNAEYVTHYKPCQ